MEATEAKILLPIVSADGKRNAYYHKCKVADQQRAYAACLHIIKCNEEGNTSSLYSDCNNAVAGRKCPALAMREKELLDGRAIYFKEREGVRLETGVPESMRKFFDGLKSAARSVGNLFASPAPAPAPARPAPKKKREDDFLSALDATPSYADVITDLAAEATAKAAAKPVAAAPAAAEPIVVKPVAAAPKIQFLPGESPLEAVRRMKLQQAQPQE